MWTAVFAVPLALNVAVWRCLLQPEQARLRAMQDAHALWELRPTLQRLLAQSELALEDLDRVGFTGGERIVAALQAIAVERRVTVQRIRAGGPSSDPSAEGLAAMPVELEATAGFGRLGRWISDMESHRAIRVDRLTLTAGAEGHALATMRLTVYLRSGS